MTAWDGDISHMGKLADRILDLARVPARASRAAADGIRARIATEFETGTDPYGARWAPLEEFTLEKRTQTSEPPLTDTGTMRDTLDVRPMAHAGVSISIAHPAAPHQTGWEGSQGSGPARPILPSGDMPATWRAEIDAAIVGEIRKAAG